MSEFQPYEAVLESSVSNNRQVALLAAVQISSSYDSRYDKDNGVILSRAKAFLEFLEQE